MVVHSFFKLLEIIIKKAAGDGMYEFTSRVRYSETGKDGRLSLESILNYFQDCTTLHSEETGYGIDYLAEQNTVWILLSWQIIVERYPKLGEKIKIVTKAYDFKKSFGYRNFIMYDEQGEYIAYANSVWLYVDAEKMLPVKVDEAQATSYGLEEKFPMEYAGMKIAIPQVPERICPSFAVQSYHLDTNDHVNNGQYLRMASIAVGKKLLVKQMRAEYKKSAVLGDIIEPKVYETENSYVVTLNNKQGAPYAVIEFMI